MKNKKWKMKNDKQKLKNKTSRINIGLNRKRWNAIL